MCLEGVGRTLTYNLTEYSNCVKNGSPDDLVLEYWDLSSDNVNFCYSKSYNDPDPECGNRPTDLPSGAGVCMQSSDGSGTYSVYLLYNVYTEDEDPTDESIEIIVGQSLCDGYASPDDYSYFYSFSVGWDVEITGGTATEDYIDSNDNTTLTLSNIEPYSDKSNDDGLLKPWDTFGVGVGTGVVGLALLIACFNCWRSSICPCDCPKEERSSTAEGLLQHQGSNSSVRSINFN